jgi:hypothetical protein
MAPNGWGSPTYNTTGIGGKPALVFVGGNTDNLQTTADVVAIGTGNTASIFMLANFTTGSFFGPFMAGNGEIAGPDASAHSFTTSIEAVGPVLSAYQNFGGPFGSATPTINTEQRWGWVLNGTTITPYANNVAGTPSALSFNFTTPGVLAFRLAESCRSHP